MDEYAKKKQSLLRWQGKIVAYVYPDSSVTKTFTNINNTSNNNDNDTNNYDSDTNNNDSDPNNITATTSNQY